MELYFYLEFREWLDVFIVSYGATPQLQLNACKQPLVKKRNLPGKFAVEVPLSDHANFGDFTSLAKKCRQF